MGPPLPSKKEVVLALLERVSVFLHIDARRTGVVVPPHLKANSQLVLHIGLNMAVPIPDLDVGEEGISCTLSFKGARFLCILPWPTIFAMVGDDGRAMVWPDDVPPEVARQAEQRAAQVQAKEARRAPGEKASRGSRARGKDASPAPGADVRTRLVSVDPAAAEPVSASDEEPAEGEPAPAEPQEGAQRAEAEPGRRPRRELPPYLRVIK